MTSSERNEGRGPRPDDYAGILGEVCGYILGAVYFGGIAAGVAVIVIFCWKLAERMIG